MRVHPASKAAGNEGAASGAVSMDATQSQDHDVADRIAKGGRQHHKQKCLQRFQLPSSNKEKSHYDAGTKQYKALPQSSVQASSANM